VHVTSGAHAAEAIVFPRVVIVAGTSAQLSVLESHMGWGPEGYFADAVSDLRVGANATVHYCKAQREASKATHIGTTRIWQERDSNLQSFSFAQGARLARNNLSILLRGESINTVMNGFYDLHGNQ